MITSADYKLMVARFKIYLGSLTIQDSVIQKHINLKVRHTYHVVSNSMLIARSTGLSQPDIQLTRAIALVHDIGRFQQFISYGTFDDSLSVNHAEFGVQLLTDLDFFNGIGDQSTRSIIILALLNHNIPAADPGLDDRTLLFAHLLRDADKLDIWEILTTRNIVNTIIESDEPESYMVPDVIYESFQNRHTVPPVAAQTMNDFRLLRLSWIYDMNFSATFRLIVNRDYVNRILSRIPPSDKKNEIGRIIQEYVAQRASL